MSDEIERKREIKLENVAPGKDSAHSDFAFPARRLPNWLESAYRFVYDYFAVEKPYFTTALIPMCFLSMILFTRWIRTNFIFDEQEALLANPYVRSVSDSTSKLTWIDAFYRDFWGLASDRSIGSYRPLPDLVWRALWGLGAREHSPFLHHWVNVLLHGINGALMVAITYRLTKDRASAWLTGLAFTAAAILTEAVSGVVGLADVLGALGALLALLALWSPLWAMPLGVFMATLIGLYSKESALCIVPLIPFAALFLSQETHPKLPFRWVRMLTALVATAAAFVLYVEARKHMFVTPDDPLASKEAHEGKSIFDQGFAAILRWYHQPALPKDPLNNPLVNAPNTTFGKELRVAGGLRVYARGIFQVIFPWTLSGDYSAPQEPLPSSPLFAESIIGGLAMLLPWIVAPILGVWGWLRFRKSGGIVHAWKVSGFVIVLAAVWLGLGEALWSLDVATRPALESKHVIHAILRVFGGGFFLVAPPAATWFFTRNLETKAPQTKPPDARPLVAVALIWIVVSYFPVSNIPILLPTVRAERFWYFPAIGTSILLGLVFSRLLRWSKRLDWSKSKSRWAVLLGSVLTQRSIHYGSIGFVTLFFLFQGVCARKHANDYNNDLTFWDATRKAVPRSAKAHLNYSVMQGARGNLEERRQANVVALKLAPEWPMANIYLGDTLCRMHRPFEAWPHYKRGFELAPNDPNLIALALQCLWDEHALPGVHEPGQPDIEAELSEMDPQYPGSWLAYLGQDIIDNGGAHEGVDPKYRPRGYNEGPKGE